MTAGNDAGAEPMRAGEREYLLAFADDEHMMGQRHTEWIGIAPFLEEDLAFASIGQDELGHATLLYELVAGPGGADDLALGRPPDEYRSCWLVELPCTDWAEALVRHWLYDRAEAERWAALTGSTDATVAAIARRALREEEYHRRHADALLLPLLAEGGEAGERLVGAFDRIVPLALAQFEPVAGEVAAIDSGLATRRWADALPGWRVAVEEVFGVVEWDGLDRPEQYRRTRRSEHFDVVYASMREVIAIDPTARW